MWTQGETGKGRGAGEGEAQERELRQGHRAEWERREWEREGTQWALRGRPAPRKDVWPLCLSHKCSGWMKNRDTASEEEGLKDGNRHTEERKQMGKGERKKRVLEKLVTDPPSTPTPSPGLHLCWEFPSPPTHLLQTFLPRLGPSRLSICLFCPSFLALWPQPRKLLQLPPHFSPLTASADPPCLTASPPPSLQPPRPPSLACHKTLLGQAAFSSLI